MMQRSGTGGRAARLAAMEDEDDDDDDEVLPYSYRGGGRRTAEGLFPKVTQPVEAGVQL